MPRKEHKKQAWNYKHPLAIIWHLIFDWLLIEVDE
jgi:hypothetical protein